MKINGFIMANRAQEVPVPVPIDPVEASITVSQIRYDYHGRKYENEDRGVVYPDYEEDISTTRTVAFQWDDNSGEYWRTQGYDTIPCNVGGSNNQSTWATLFFNADGFWNGRHNVYDYMNYWGATGSFTVDVRSFTPGDYVFQLIHWFGYQDLISDRTVRVDGNKGRVIKQGTHGVIEGTVYPEVVSYAGNGDLARGQVVKAVLKYAFTVNQGDTAKTFEFGRGKEISFEDLWTCVYMTEGGPSVWANVSTSFSAKVYTAR